MKKALHRILLVLAVLLTVAAAFVGNAFFGNPISHLLAKNAAGNHLHLLYSDTDYTLESVQYNFKFNDYVARVSSASSIDSHFYLTISPFGQIQYDSYEDDVASGWNTWERLDAEYGAMAKPVLEELARSYTVRIDYGALWQENADGRPGTKPDLAALGLTPPELDKDYDIKALGAQAGQIVLYIQDDAADIERAADILLDVRETFDAANVPFYVIDLVLQTSKNPTENAVNIAGFPYSEIKPEGLTQRVLQAHQELTQWYAVQDMGNKFSS